jgi:hypothetical protein
MAHHHKPMMARSRTLVLFAASLALAGCEWKVTSRVGVQVVAPREAGRGDRSLEAPIEGARVSVECPDELEQGLGVTDRAGLLLATAGSPVRVDCTLVVARDGRTLARLPAWRACSIRSGSECRAVEARVRLDIDAAALNARRGGV